MTIRGRRRPACWRVVLLPAHEALHEGDDAEHEEDWRVEEDVAGHQAEHEPDDRPDHHGQAAEDARDRRAGVVALRHPATHPFRRPALLLAVAATARPAVLVLVVLVVAIQPGARFRRDATIRGRSDARRPPLLDGLDLEDFFLLLGHVAFDDLLLGLLLVRIGDDQDAGARGTAGLAAGPFVLGTDRAATVARHHDGHGMLRERRLGPPGLTSAG